MLRPKPLTFPSKCATFQRKKLGTATRRELRQELRTLILMKEHIVLESEKLDRCADLLISLMSNGYSRYLSDDFRRAMNAEIDRIGDAALAQAETEHRRSN